MRQRWLRQKSAARFILRVSPILVGLLPPVGCKRQVDALPTQELRERRDALIESFERLPNNTSYEAGVFLRMLIESSGAKRGVEVGSGNGYGALHMGMGFERNGGELLTIEIDPGFHRECTRNIEAAGLSRTVRCIEGDALEVIPTLDGPIHFVYIDAVKEDTLRYFRAIEPKLAPGALVVVDNAIRFAWEMNDLFLYIDERPDWQMVRLRPVAGQSEDGVALLKQTGGR